MRSVRLAVLLCSLCGCVGSDAPTVRAGGSHAANGSDPSLVNGDFDAAGDGLTGWEANAARKVQRGAQGSATEMGRPGSAPGAALLSGEGARISQQVDWPLVGNRTYVLAARVYAPPEGPLCRYDLSILAESVVLASMELDSVGTALPDKNVIAAIERSDPNVRASLGVSIECLTDGAVVIDDVSLTEYLSYDHAID